jgi:competence protein ComEA
MLLDSRLNTKTGLVLVVWFAAVPAWGQLPAGPGREETQRMCSGCHEFERSISLRQDRDGWKATINKMLSFGAQSTDEEFTAVLEYLSTNFPAEVAPRLNVNTAKAIDFESRLSLKRSEAAAVIQYRDKHGNFKSIEDLKRVPGIDAGKVEAKRNILVF